MNTITSKQIGLVLGYTILLSNIVLLVSDFNFKWFLVTCQVILFNVICGTIGASLIHTKFFKQEMTLKNFGLWTAIVFAGPIVLVRGLTYKPPHYMSY